MRRTQYASREHEAISTAFAAPRDAFDMIVDKLIRDFDDAMFWRWQSAKSEAAMDCYVKLSVAYENHMRRVPQGWDSV